MGSLNISNWYQNGMTRNLQEDQNTLRDMNERYVAEIKSEDPENSVVRHKMSVVFKLKGRM